MTYWISDFDLLDSFSVQKGHDESDRSQIYLEFDEEDFATFERNINEIRKKIAEVKKLKTKLYDSANQKATHA